jgi:hypothetical protein
VSLGQLKVMSAIERCRTAALGGMSRCEDCAHTQIAYNSCRNRHCPKCQRAAAKALLALMVGLFRQSATARAAGAEVEVGRTCDGIAGAYRFYSAGWRGVAFGSLGNTLLTVSPALRAANEGPAILFTGDLENLPVSDATSLPAP